MTGVNLFTGTAGVPPASAPSGALISNWGQLRTFRPRQAHASHHISLHPVLLKNFSTPYYEAGHMMYIDEKSLSRLTSDVGKFIQDSLKK